MRPDFIYCGSCSLEFPLSELTFFIEHKRSKCSNTLFETKYEDLQCSQCVRSFHTPWPLIFHVQNDHGIKLVRNLDSNSELGCQMNSGLTTPQFSCEPAKSSTDEALDDSNWQDSSVNNVALDKFSSEIYQSNGLALRPLTTTVSLSSISPQGSKCFCRDSSKEAEKSGLKFQGVSYDSHGCSPLNIALNLEEGLRLIHRISCSKLDMHLRQMTSIDVANASSSYALSLCCSQTGVSCLCTVDSCSCNPNPPTRHLKASASCQTDGLSDPGALDVLPSPNLFSIPDKPSMDLDKSPVTQDFSFLNSLIQPSCSTSPDSDLSLQTPPQPPKSHPQSTDIIPSSTRVLSFSCSFCGRIYRQKIHLRKHVMAQHTKQKPFFCPHCNYSTVEKSHLTVHIRTHTGEKPFICRVCHYSSTQNCTLKSHYLRKHPENRINCGSCGGSYVTELEYQNHLKNCSSFG